MRRLICALAGICLVAALGACGGDDTGPTVGSYRPDVKSWCDGQNLIYLAPTGDIAVSPKDQRCGS